MRGCNISRFVAPDCPSTERQLTEKKCDPQHRQPLERGDLWHISPNARRKRNDCGCNQQCQKPVRHLQPDLESVHVRQAAGIAPGIDLCQRDRACVWNPGAVCSGKIENRQIASVIATASVLVGVKFFAVVLTSQSEFQKLVVTSAITTSRARNAWAMHAWKMPISSFSMVTRRPPRIPCRITPASARPPKLRTH